MICFNGNKKYLQQKTVKHGCQKQKKVYSLEIWKHYENQKRYKTKFTGITGKITLGYIPILLHGKIQ